MRSTPTLRRTATATAAAIAAALTLAACGGASHPAAAGPSRPSPAAPISGPRLGWPSLLDGPSHFGGSTAVGPRTDRIRWRRSLGAAIVAGPVISAGGTAYLAAANGDLHAIDIATGRDVWTFHGDGSFPSGDLSTSALILPSGEILWPGPDARLYALSPAGKLLWTLTGTGPLLTPVLDRRAGLLILADQTGHISGYRLAEPRRRPARVWSRRLTRASFGNPVVAADGSIYQTAGDCLFALSPTGRVRWSVTTPALVEVSPAIATDGVVVFGSDNRREYGVDPDGQVRWSDPIGNYTYSSPLALPGRRVIYGNHSGQMTLLDSDTGRVIRRDAGTGQIWTAAAVDRAGDVYFATRLGQIYGFGADGRRRFDLDTGGKYDSYPALAPDGTLLVGGDNGTLYAIG
jgi:outer membrane protein assembly factor BamB